MLKIIRKNNSKLFNKLRKNRKSPNYSTEGKKGGKQRIIKNQEGRRQFRYANSSITFK